MLTKYLEKKRVILRGCCYILKEGKVGSGTLSRRCRSCSTMRFDSSVEGKCGDLEHIDFDFASTSNYQNGMFFDHVHAEFTLNN